MPPRWDIFCTVVDNYGDAGVSWRLARQLVAEQGLGVRLWIDRPEVLRRLWPTLTEAGTQMAAGVEVRHWTAPLDFDAPAEVVIEAFGCELPADYLDAMAARRPPSRWLDLEYLSAESWVAGCHGLPSPQPRGLCRHFFFPGFGADTGGLPVERDLLARRLAFQQDPRERQAFLAPLGALPPAGVPLLSLFAYDHPAVDALLERLAAGSTPVWCLVPEGRVLRRAASWAGTAVPAAGARLQRGALTVVALPFLDQDAYDRLLWSCDINGVRGEDSFLRAQWAGRPMIWQPYPQPEGAHWPKLDAFLDRYGEGLPVPVRAAQAALWRAFSGEGDLGAAFDDWWQSLPALGPHAERWARRWCEPAAEQNLAARLVRFCSNQV